MTCYYISMLNLFWPLLKCMWFWRERQRETLGQRQTESMYRVVFLLFHAFVNKLDHTCLHHWASQGQSSIGKMFSSLHVQQFKKRLLLSCFQNISSYIEKHPMINTARQTCKQNNTVGLPLANAGKILYTVLKLLLIRLKHRTRLNGITCGNVICLILGAFYKLLITLTV